jgi:hypothetical protein
MPRAQEHLAADVPIVSVSKGLEVGSGRMMSELIPSALGRKQPMAFLSGPSFAKEVMDLRPTGVVAASKARKPPFNPLLTRVTRPSPVAGAGFCRGSGFGAARRSLRSPQPRALPRKHAKARARRERVHRASCDRVARQGRATGPRAPLPSAPARACGPAARRVSRGGGAQRRRPAQDAKLAREMQQLFASPYMRVNTTADVTGVEICGALKNVLALAAGIVEGLDLGHNAMAALVAQARARGACAALRGGSRCSLKV